MKNIFTLCALALTTLTFAQSEEAAETKKHTLSFHAMHSEPGQIGLSYEKMNKDRSFIVNLSYGYMNYEVGPIEANGNGFVIELGGRDYFGKESKGLYYSNMLSYGNINFDNSEIDGTYSYFSFFVPQVGYKIQFGNVVIDPYIGVMWKIEVKGKGDVDNNYTDEWVMRGGVRIGYSF